MGKGYPLQDENGQVLETFKFNGFRFLSQLKTIFLIIFLLKGLDESVFARPQKRKTDNHLARTMTNFGQLIYCGQINKNISKQDKIDNQSLPCHHKLNSAKTKHFVLLGVGTKSSPWGGYQCDFDQAN